MPLPPFGPRVAPVSAPLICKVLVPVPCIPFTKIITGYGKVFVTATFVAGNAGVAPPRLPIPVTPRTLLVRVAEDGPMEYGVAISAWKLPPRMLLLSAEFATSYLKPY